MPARDRYLPGVTQQSQAHPELAHKLPPVLIIACSAACGVMVANLYYAQPLIALIAPSLHLGDGFGGLIVTLTQLGYASGLLLIVPLADRVENRRLILITLGLAAAALVALAIAPSAVLFLIAAAVVGCFSAGAQVIVPLAAALTHESTRGRTIGAVMSGLLAGIMLARPAASLVANFAGWRAVFWLSALLMLAIAAWLSKACPGTRAQGRQLWPDPGLDDSHPAGRAQVAAPGGLSGPGVRGVQHVLDRRPAGPGTEIRFRPEGHRPLRPGRRGRRPGRASGGPAGRSGACKARHRRRPPDHHRQRILVGLGGGDRLGGATGGVRDRAGRRGAGEPGAGPEGDLFPARRGAGRINAIYMTIVFLLGAGGSAIATLAYHAGGWRAAMLAAGVIGGIDVALFATELRKRA